MQTDYDVEAHPVTLLALLNVPNTYRLYDTHTDVFRYFQGYFIDLPLLHLHHFILHVVCHNVVCNCSEFKLRESRLFSTAA